MGWAGACPEVVAADHSGRESVPAARRCASGSAHWSRLGRPIGLAVILPTFSAEVGTIHEPWKGHEPSEGPRAVRRAPAVRRAMIRQSLRRLELDKRREVGVIVNDLAVVKQMRAVFEEDWAKTDSGRAAAHAPEAEAATTASEDRHAGSA